VCIARLCGWSEAGKNVEQGKMTSITAKINETLKGIDILPKVQVSKEVQQELADIMSFVFPNGAVSSQGMPSKRHQLNVLCQVYSWDQDREHKQYTALAQVVYENAIAKENPYKEITDTPEFYEQLRFAFENTVLSLMRISKDKSKAREYLAAIDNLSDRLLLINPEMFTKLFLLLHEYHFWHVYNRDEDYSYHLQTIKKRLKLYHGIKQSDFYKKASISKEDVSFTLYFAEKAGGIVRIKEGRTYRLYLPEDNPEEITPYEYTKSAVTDGDFNYKDYWKDIEKVLKQNKGILQSDFCSKFDYAVEIVRQVLRDAEQDKKIRREKKGNSYLLYLAE
jgi:hypothetical protein